MTGFRTIPAPPVPDCAYRCLTCGKRYDCDGSSWSPDFCSMACDPDPYGDAADASEVEKCRVCKGRGT